MFKTSAGRGLAVIGTAAILSACIPVVVPGAQPPATGGPVGATAAGDLRFDTSTLQLNTGETRSLIGLAKLNGQVLDPATAGQYSWQASPPGVLAVDAAGQARGLAPGEATVVLASATNPAVRAAMIVKVVANQGAVQITITPATAVMEPGERLTLTAAVTQATGAISGNVQWSSSDNTIAVVNNATGEVSAIKEGRVTIRAVSVQDPNASQVAELRIVADKQTAIPDAQPSTVIFGGGAPSPSPSSAGPAEVRAPGHWEPIATGATETVTGIRMADAKTGFVMGEKGLLLKTVDGGKTWTPDYPVSLGFQYVEEFDFGTAAFGLAQAGGRLYRTTDGGAEWAVVDALPQGARWFKCFGDTALAITSQQELMRSDDGGATWEKAIADLPAGVSPQIATMVGDEVIAISNKLHRKIPDLGWVGFDLPLAPVQVHAVSDQVMYFMGGAYVGQLQSVWLTTDGGKNTAQLTTGLYDGAEAAYGEGMDWVDADHGFLVRGNPGNVNGVQAAILATDDGGQTWRTTPVDHDPNRPLDNVPKFIDMVSTKVGFAAGGRGKVFRYVPNP